MKFTTCHNLGSILFAVTPSSNTLFQYLLCAGGWADSVCKIRLNASIFAVDSKAKEALKQELNYLNLDLNKMFLFDLFETNCVSWEIFPNFKIQSALPADSDAQGAQVARVRVGNHFAMIKIAAYALFI
jgi:hypothetical protein